MMPIGGSKRATTRLLTTGGAAEYLGVSEDVVRALETSGELRAVRTPGNHRRFAVQDLDALLGHWETPPRAARPPLRPVPHTTTPSIIVSRPAAGPDPLFEMDSVEQENRAMERAEARTRQEGERRVAAERAAVELQAQRDAAKAEQGRLDGLKQHGRDRARWSHLPAEWMARVVQDLETFVTPRVFPSWAGEEHARAAVTARVDQVVAAFRAREAKAADERRAEQKRTALIAYGKHYAWSETLQWDTAGQDGARQDVQQALEDEVASDWTEPMVKELVNDVLDDWTEED